MAGVDIPIKLGVTTPGAAGAVSEFQKLEKAIASDEKAARILEKQLRRINKSSKVDVAQYRKLNGALSTVRGRLDKNANAFARMASQADRAEKETKQLAAATQKLRVPRGATMGGAGGGLSIGGMASALGIVQGLQAAAHMAAGAVKAIALEFKGAAEFGSELQFSMTKFLGSEKAAYTEIAKIRHMSQKLGIDFQQAGKDFKSYFSASGDLDLSRDLVALRADLAAINPENAEKVAMGFEAIEKALAKGKLEADGMNSILAGLPLNLEDIQRSYSKITGESLETVKAMNMTDYNPKKLAQAIKAATLLKTGAKELGDIAIEKQLSTIPGAAKAIFSRVGNIADDIFAEMGAGGGGAFLDILKDINKWFASDDYKQFTKDVGAGLNLVGGYIKSMLPVAKALWNGLKKGFGAASPVIGKVAEAFAKVTGSKGGIDGLIKAAEGLGKVVGYMAAIGIAAAGMAATVVASMQRVGGFIMNHAQIMYGMMANVGKAMIDGIKSGLLGAAGGLYAIIQGIMGKSVSTAKGAIQSNSPSKLFASEVGEPIPQGAAMGIDQKAGLVSNAVQGMLSPAVDKASTMSQTFNRNSTSNNVRVGEISVNGGGDPQTAAAMVRNTIADLFAGEQLVRAT